MFLVSEIDLGTVSVGSTHKIVFKYDTALVKQVTRVTLSCECESYHIDTNAGTINIAFKAKDVPPHLIQRQKYYYKMTKNVVVAFTTIHGEQMAKELKYKVKVTRHGVI